MTGRSGVGQVSRDLIIEDASGFVPLHYRGKLVGAEVTVRGWYRRTPTPGLQVLELLTADGQRIRTHSWRTLLVLSWVLLAAGAVTLLITLPTSP